MRHRIVGHNSFCLDLPSVKFHSPSKTARHCIATVVVLINASCMGSEPRLTIEEQVAARIFRQHKWSFRAIGKELGRSKDTVRAYLVAPDTYGKKRKGRKATKIVHQECRLLYRAAAKSGESARSLHASLRLSGSIRTCQRRLKASGFLKYKKRKHMPHLKEAHKAARLKYATGHLENPPNWTEVIWSDEKKFNLDGPDGFQYYWEDLRKEPATFFTRASKDGGVMVWGAFSGAGLSDLAFLDGKQDSGKYINTLGDYLFPFAHMHYGPEFVFMQDNASIHRSKVTMKFLEDHEVKLFDHPALSPDLNPIENVWGYLVRQVYPNGKQYLTKEDLVAAIKSAWSNIPLDYLDNLIKSMPKRCLAVVRAKGSKCDY